MVIVELTGNIERDVWNMRVVVCGFVASLSITANRNLWTVPGAMAAPLNHATVRRDGRFTARLRVPLPLLLAMWLNVSAPRWAVRPVRAVAEYVRRQIAYRRYVRERERERIAAERAVQAYLAQQSTGMR